MVPLQSQRRALAWWTSARYTKPQHVTSFLTTFAILLFDVHACVFDQSRLCCKYLSTPIAGTHKLPLAKMWLLFNPPQTGPLCHRCNRHHWLALGHRIIARNARQNATSDRYARVVCGAHTAAG